MKPLEMSSRISVSWLVALMRHARHIPSLLCGVFAVGCATGDLPPRTMSDPANPAAKEGLRFVIESPMTDAATADAGGHEHHHGATSAETGTLYTCPMHPEVVQDHPGSCPKCGMTLKAK